MGLFDNIKETTGLSSLFAFSAGPTRKPAKPASDAVKQEGSSDREKVAKTEETAGNTAVSQPVKPKKASSKKRNAETREIEDIYLEKIAEDSADTDMPTKAPEETVHAGSDDSDDAQDTEKAGKLPAATENPATKTIENELEKAKKTIFVGNVSNTVISSKSDYSSFKKLFSDFGKVKSIRFRSIAFAEMLPRKIAFVQQNLHPSRDAVNAYIVFEEEASVKKALALNATVFLGHHLRVDSVAHPAPQEPRKCVFVGNLDFECKEESLWMHFEGCGSIESVRIIRDKKTNVGKGFAYVQFKDPLSVTKALRLENQKLGNRALRISRCKSMASGPVSKGAKHNSKGNVRLSQKEKTQVGRAKTVLGNSGRSKAKAIEEGARAKPGDISLKQGNAKRKAKITDRSSKWKKQKN